MTDATPSTRRPPRSGRPSPGGAALEGFDGRAVNDAISFAGVGAALFDPAISMVRDTAVPGAAGTSSPHGGSTCALDADLRDPAVVLAARNVGRRRRDDQPLRPGPGYPRAAGRPPRPGG